MSVSQSVNPPEKIAIPAMTAAESTRNMDASIARISQRLNNVTAGNFLDEYVLGLCEELGADYIAVGRLNPFSNIMRTLRFVSGGKLTTNFVYSLDGTPCADAIQDGVCVHKSNVVEHYPRDQDLIDLNICSYAGASMQNATGATLGVIVALWCDPLPDAKFVTGVLDYFRQRVGSVIETVETLERYTWAISNVFSGVWDWDLRTGGVIVSKEFQQILGGAGEKKTGAYDLTHIEDAMHPDDRPKHIEALKRHINESTPYDLRVRLRDHTGVYRWYLSRGRATRDANGKPERMIGGFCDIHDTVIALEKAPRG